MPHAQTAAIRAHKKYNTLSISSVTHQTKTLVAMWGKTFTMWGKTLKHFLNDERGLEVVEYSILTGLIVAGALSAIAAIGTWVAGVFNSVKTAIGA